MKNRERIKSALLLSIKEETRLQCKEGGFTKVKIEEFLLSKSQDFEHASEYIIDQYDSFLTNKLANELTSALKKSIEKDNQLTLSRFSEIMDKININHSTTNKSIADLSLYQKTIRQKVLKEEISHLKEDFDLLKQHKKALDRIAKSEADKVSWLFVFIAFTSVLIWCGLIYNFGWDMMEQWTWISALVLIFINGLFFAFFEQNLTREDLRQNKLKRSTEHIYQLYKFDENLLDRYKNLLEIKNKEIDRFN